MLGFIKLGESLLEIIGNIIVGPFKQSKDMELVMIMIVFPIICNGCQFWIIDNFLKLSTVETKEITDISLEDIDKHDTHRFSNISGQANTNKEHEINITSDNVVDFDSNNIKKGDKLINDV
jgi:hypothetical protein